MKNTLFSLPRWGRGTAVAVDEVSTHTISHKTSPSPKGATSPKRRGRRGFTIVELVVTLTIIVLVSSVAIGVVAVDNKTHAETINMLEATNIAENAIECFRIARNATDGKDEGISSHCLDMFEDAFKRSLGYKKNEEGVVEPDSVSLSDRSYSENKVTYTVTKDGVTVTLVFSDGIEDGDNFSYNTITVSASSSTDDNLLEPKSYTVR